MKLHAAALGIAAAGALLLAGCGSSQHRPSAATGPVGAPPPFSEVLDAVCRPANHQVRLGGRKWAGEEQDYLRKLRALSPPHSQQATYAKFLTTFQTVIEGFGVNKPTALRAAVENQHLRRQLHAPDCGLPEVAF
jgi:hypothetical protein